MAVKACFIIKYVLKGGCWDWTGFRQPRLLLPLFMHTQTSPVTAFLWRTYLALTFWMQSTGCP